LTREFGTPVPTVIEEVLVSQYKYYMPYQYSNIVLYQTELYQCISQTGGCMYHYPGSGTGASWRNEQNRFEIKEFYNVDDSVVYGFPEFEIGWLWQQGDYTCYQGQLFEC
jgi:hypothetical protein